MKRRVIFQSNNKKQSRMKKEMFLFVCFNTCIFVYLYICIFVYLYIFFCLPRISLTSFAARFRPSTTITNGKENKHKRVSLKYTSLLFHSPLPLLSSFLLFSLSFLPSTYNCPDTLNVFSCLTLLAALIAVTQSSLSAGVCAVKVYLSEKLKKYEPKIYKNKQRRIWMFAFVVMMK